MLKKKLTYKETSNSRNAYFVSLELENIRCFGKKQKIVFSNGEGNPKQWTIILGDNGTGKTTILQSLVGMLPVPDMHGNISVSVPNMPSRFLNIKTLTSKPKSQYYIEAFYSIQTSLSSPKKEIVTLTVEPLRDNSDPDYMALWEVITMNCFAYGASRKTGDTSFSEQNEGSAYETLFDETFLLVNPGEWLLQADYAASKPSGFKQWALMRRDKVVEILKLILPDVSDINFGSFRDDSKKPRVEFLTPYGWVESKNLSLGYRSSMAWIVDFVSRMFDIYPESENPLAEPAVVIIDEIDLHLHPKWQRDLLPWLSDLFPNTQFIVTTHSPLIVQAAVAREANLVVCKLQDDHIVVDQSVEGFKNWRADQVLTSDFFDLPTARPKEIEGLLKEKEKILSKPKLTKKDERRLKKLESEIGFLPVSEDSNEDEAMRIIKKAAEWLGN